MRKSNLTFVVIALFVIGLSFTSCDNQSTDSAETEQTEDKSENAAGYACPMHPEITGQNGDKCSICGMNLTPISGEEHEGHNH